MVRHLFEDGDTGKDTGCRVKRFDFRNLVPRFANVNLGRLFNISEYRL